MSIFDSKVKPLKVSSCVCIRSQEDVIGPHVTTFDDQIKVSTLKTGIKWVKYIFSVFGNLSVKTLTFWVHSNEIIRVINLVLYTLLAKYLFKKSIVAKFTSFMMFGKIEFVTHRSILQLSVCKPFMHLICIVRSSFLVNDDVRV